REIAILKGAEHFFELAAHGADVFGGVREQIADLEGALFCRPGLLEDELKIALVIFDFGAEAGEAFGQRIEKNARGVPHPSRHLAASIGNQGLDEMLAIAGSRELFAL